MHYDEGDLVRGLVRVPVRLQAAFAAACAERLFPAYEAFCQRTREGDQVALAGILQRIWRDLLSGETEVERVRSDLARCMALIPDEHDDPWVDEQPYADDAASAIAYTLRALESGEAQEAAWAARRAYEAIDHHVMHRLGVDREDQVMAHPLVQAELARQRRDLDQVLAGSDPVQVITQLRERALSQAPVFFGRPT